jgi:hypothetical protein
MMLRCTMIGSTLLLVATACTLEPDKRRAKKACGAPPAMTTATFKLPVAFPVPAGVTLTSEKAAGPSTIVTAYRNGKVMDAWDAFKQSLSTNGYAVTKSDHEGVEGDVAFEGRKTTGSVKLVQECRDRTKVTITVRPA